MIKISGSLKQNRHFWILRRFSPFWAALGRAIFSFKIVVFNRHLGNLRFFNLWLCFKIVVFHRHYANFYIFIIKTVPKIIIFNIKALFINILLFGTLNSYFEWIKRILTPRIFVLSGLAASLANGLILVEIRHFFFAHNTLNFHLKRRFARKRLNTRWNSWFFLYA